MPESYRTMDAITKARDWFADEQMSIFWLNPLLQELKRKLPESGCRWGLRCLRRMLPLTGTQKLATLLADVDQLEGHIQNKFAGTDDEMNRLIREIWDRPGRDAAQTAISHLYGARARTMRQGELYFGFQDVVNVLVFRWLSDDHGPVDNAAELVDIIIEEFERALRESDG
jgi:hypothetical protein